MLPYIRLSQIVVNTDSLVFIWTQIQTTVTMEDLQLPNEPYFIHLHLITNKQSLYI